MNNHFKLYIQYACKCHLELPCSLDILFVRYGVGGGGGGGFPPPPCRWVFCPLFKISSSNPYLNILHLSKHFVANTPMNKKIIQKFSFTPSQSTQLHMGLEPPIPERVNFFEDLLNGSSRKKHIKDTCRVWKKVNWENEIYWVSQNLPQICTASAWANIKHALE